MTKVFVSLGSNINPQKHVRNGLNELEKHFASLIISPVYESIAIGFEGDNFINLVAKFDTVLDIHQVSNILTDIEDQNGRTRDNIKFSARTLDIDLLLYGQLSLKEKKINLPRPEIYHNAFVLKPLADIAENLIDIHTGKTYGQLWNEFNQSSQQLWQINL